MRRFLFILLAGFFACSCAQATRVVLGDEQFSAYLPLLEGKRVALLSNQSGIVGDRVENWCLQGGQEVPGPSPTGPISWMSSWKRA